jgi:OmpA-OmpF porin, OOP family
MSKTTIAMGLLLGLSGFTQAEETPVYPGWLGGFVEFNDIDKDKPEPNGYFDDGMGVGAELGFRFTPQWAARIEWSHLNIRATDNHDKQDGDRFGVDAMYFLPDDMLYVFGGLKHEDLGHSYRLANVGVGKHLYLTDQLRLIMEAAVYHDIDDSFKDYSVKLGFSYTFGDNRTSVSRVKPSMPKDSDNDGVYDGEDACPGSMAGDAVDNRGCSLDIDGDGVMNDMDMCPNTPKGTKVGAKGCSLILDTDQDGVLDDKDDCANTPIMDKVDNQGCSIFVDKEVSVSLRVLFDNNSSNINNPEDSKFAEFAEFMARFPNTKAVIEGHSSAAGEADYNQTLSEKRARAVVELLISKYAIDSARLTAIGYGESRLLDDSNTKEAHSINRRIEAKVTALEKVKLLKQ